MKKIDISNRFHIIDPSLIREYLEMGAAPFIPEEADEAVALKPVVFSQSPQTGDNGTFWRQNFSAAVSNSTLLKYNNTKAYIIFHMNDGSIRMIGSSHEAPLIQVTPHPGAVQITVDFDTPDPLLL